jgi:hypothetical protein
MGQVDSSCTQPHRGARLAALLDLARELGVAVQVDPLESKL